MGSAGKWIAIGLAGAALVGTVGYEIGRRGGTADMSQRAGKGADRPSTMVADAHKGLGLGGGASMLPKAMTGQAARQAPAPYRPPEPEAGKPIEGTAPMDKSSPFVHFQVGNSNVKDVFVDGDVVWAGTSSGLVMNNRKTGAFKAWDTRSGLLSKGVFHVSKLPDGKVLVGTYGGGLSVLDTKTWKFENYNVPEGLADAFVYDTLVDRKGDLWIATWSGLNRVRGAKLAEASAWETFDKAGTSGGIPNDWVYGLSMAPDGTVWIATEGGVARHLGNGRFESWDHSKGLGADYDKVKADSDFQNDPSKVSEHHRAQKKEMGLSGTEGAYNPNYVVALEVASDGSVWAGTWGGGLSVWKNGAWKTYTVADGLPGNHVFLLKRDPKTGGMWVGGSRGLVLVSKGSVPDFLGAATLTKGDGLFSEQLFSMGFDSDGGVWAGHFGAVSWLKALPPGFGPKPRKK